MKYLALILFFAASSAFAGDSTAVVWTSDTTYVRGGVEYFDPAKSYRTKIYEKEDNGEQPGDYIRVQNEYIKSRRIPPPRVIWFGYPSVCWWYYHGPDWATYLSPQMATPILIESQPFSSRQS